MTRRFSSIHLCQQGSDEIEDLICRIEKIETAVEPKLLQDFVEAMAITYKTAEFANFRKVQIFPPIKIVTTSFGHPLPSSLGEGRLCSIALPTLSWGWVPYLFT